MSARNRYKRERRKRLAEEAVQRPKREAEILAWQEELMTAAHDLAAFDGLRLELAMTARDINALMLKAPDFGESIRQIVRDDFDYGDPREPFDPDK